MTTELKVTEHSFLDKIPDSSNTPRMFSTYGQVDEKWDDEEKKRVQVEIK